GHVEDPIQAAVQRGRDFAADGGLAAAALAGAETDTAQLNEVAEPRLELMRSGGDEEVGGLDVLAEGVTGEAEVSAIHQRSPFFTSSSEKRRAELGTWSLAGLARCTKQLALVSSRRASAARLPWSQTCTTPCGRFGA